MAKGKPCIYNEDGRPLVGYIIINMANYQTDTDYLQDNILSILHEATHVLCFDENLFDDFIDPSTGSVYTSTVNYNLVLNIK